MKNVRLFVGLLFLSVLACVSCSDDDPVAVNPPTSSTPDDDDDEPGEVFDYTTLFKDQTCSELKDGITQEDIDKCAELFYQSIAQALYDGTYPKEARIREFEALPDPEIHAEANLINSCSRYEHVTGIYVRARETLTLFVGDIPKGQSLGLRVRDWSNKEETEYTLQGGLNQPYMKNEGLVYVKYHKNPVAEMPAVKIHFATGKVNGYFDVAKHSLEEWPDIIANSCCDFFDMLGERTQIVFHNNDFKQYCSNPFELMAAYDEIIELAEDFCGMVKYDRPLANRIMVCYNYSSNGAMAAGNGFVFWNTTDGLSIPEAVQADYIKTESWGLAHEVGHELQLRPGRSRYKGMTEVTNNLIPAYVQLCHGLDSRLYSKEGISSKKTGHQSEFERAMTYYQAEKRPHNYNMQGTRTVLTKLIPLWQLYLYSAEVLGQDWFKDYYQRLLTDEYAGKDGAAQMQVIRIFCEISELNLLDFFEHSGFLTPTDEPTNTGDAVFTVTPEMVQSIREEIEAKQFPKPDVEIWRLTDQKDNIEAFKNKNAIVAGTAMQNGTTFEMIDWQNVAAYEVYTQEKLVYVSPHDSFTVVNAEVDESTYVMAVSATGNKVKVTIQ